MHHRARNFIAELFRERGRIKTKHRQKTFSQNFSADVDKLCSTEEDKLECTITKQKDSGNEVTYDVPNFNVSNVFECGRNNPDVPYERAYMATSGNEYFTEILKKIQTSQGGVA